MRRLALRLIIIMVVWLACPTAQADHKDVARRAFTEATRYYDLAEYERALNGFKKAYLNYEDAAFLYNIAQCHRHLGNKVDAITFYRNFLRKVPDAPNRNEVQKIVKTLENELAAEQAREEPSPPVAVTPSPQPPAEQPSRSPTSPIAKPTTSASLVLAASPPPRSTPLYRKWWLWTSVGVVVVGVGVGLGIGLTAGRSNESAFQPVHVQ